MKQALAEIASILQYLIDRGETENITDVHPKNRYINPLPEIDSFTVTTHDGKKYKITAEEVK